MPSPSPTPLNPDLIDTATPPIPEAQGWARAYDGRSGPLIDLSQAVPGSPPPAALLERLAEAAGRPDQTRYGAITGDLALREAYAAETSAFYGAPISPEEIAITAGCNQAYVVTMMAVARAGDNVLLPTPWYFNHEMTLNMLGVEPRPLPCDPAQAFVPDIATAESLIDERTRAIVLVTPNNPTGAVYPPATIAAFAALCRRRNIWLVLDETYRDFLPDGAGRSHELFAASDWRDSLIGLYSFSKAYAVPGWRLGAITAGTDVLAQIGKVLDCIQISPVRAGQGAIAWGIDGIRAWREANRSEINARAGLFRRAMAPLNGWSVLAAGAYFAYLAHPFEAVPAAEVVRRLVQERGVLALPGPYFGPGQERHLRIAIANVGADRLGELGDRLQGFSL
ncbi:aminotransferase [Bosea sp. (in: a-proteobacteria)]|uniref:aminotransferase n=1 Tax=Bosea sp. (in: a-proteobacteria) TaxID=1871050 RepID=UPI00086C1794|nr:aminotransferase [Bosea sp. (in: a-proteobacteria)]MBN9438567.1 aminotransferase [Bosea sp. (in: a-proteobacteria)]MBN9449406.1 aminotransferase [Bosea sp. (in: a-proteobacteria)]ODT43507.1 MAG: aspartate/tyrosine/aromatic aminotransferase [Methylobacterium sp. SCN 67-24]